MARLRALARRVADRACRCRRAALGVVLRETVRRNRVRDGIVYLQVTRGVARRDHVFPPAGTAPSVVVTARTIDTAADDEGARQRASRSITVPDNRWERVDIKSISLLPNVLAKQAAREQGARRPGSSIATAT